MGRRATGVFELFHCYSENRFQNIGESMKEKPWLKHYEGHVPHSLTYPPIPLQRFLTDTATNHPDYTALSFNETHLTYRELNERVNRFAQALREQGVEKGRPDRFYSS